MEDKTYQIYDKMTKKILTLSAKAVINLINGLFQTDYPTDSRITYNWTEFEDQELKRILADAILTINDTDSYHIEAQMTKEDDIVLRIFEYGFGHALRMATVKDGVYHIQFPQPKILYLYYKGKVPDEYQLHIHFDKEQSFVYRVPTEKLPDISAEELSRRKMIILIPFYLLKLRDLLEKERSEENLRALKNLLLHDILGSINENLRVENITVSDAQRLISYTRRLYNHLYSQYEEMEALNDMMDESFMTDADLIVKECDARLEEVTKILEEKLNELARKQNELKEKDGELTSKESELAAKNNELIAKNEELTSKENELAAKNDELAAKESELTAKNNELAEKEREIQRLQEILKKNNLI